MTMTRRTTSILTTLTAATAGVLIGDACKFSELRDHCANADGDAYCARKYDDEADPRPYCARGTDECTPKYPAEGNDGCVAERPDDDMCYSPCGGRKSALEDSDCEGVADDDSSSTADGSASVTASSTETTGPTSTTSSMTGNTMSTTDASSSSGPQGCAGDDECEGPGTPICIDQVCSPCENDAQCAAKDPASPACRDDGQCVQCTASNDDGCGGATPVCDAAVNSCVGCSFHEQCPDSACRIATGECFDEADVVHVDADVVNNLSTEFVDGAVIILHNYGTMTAYQVNLSLDGGVAAILAAPGDAPRIQSLGGAAAITVQNGGELYLANGVQVIGSTEAMYPGVAVDNASLYLDRARVVNNDGGGISLDSGAYAQIRNSFVGGSGDSPATVVTDATLVANYSSLVGSTGDSASVVCNAGASVTVRNSLLVSRASAVSDILCDNASISDSAMEANFPGGTNITPLGVMTSVESSSWFAGYASGDFRLNNPPAALLTAAQWQSGDPLIDIEGAPRPNVDGSADVAGADLP